MNNRGFSLLELVIALLFSSIIIMIIVATMRFASTSERKGTQKQDVSQHIRVVTSQLIFLIKGTYPYVATVDGESKYYFEGESDSIRFITSSVTQSEGSLIDKPGLKWVRIFRDLEGLKILDNFFFLSDDYDSSATRERVLDDMVTEITFEYLDTGENRDEQPEWKSEWSAADKKYLPVAIKVSLSVQGEDGAEETTFPPFIVRIQMSKKVN